jgi:hypothetical protein
VSVRRWPGVAAGALAVAAAVLGYGAWRAATHASVWLSVHDHAGRTPNLLWRDVTDGLVVLRDGAGRPRAEARLEPPQGLPRWVGPAGAAVDCRPSADRDAWRRCFDAQSRWFAGWAPQVTLADVTVGSCRIERAPVARRSSGDWWLWWVPLPHVGGTPVGHHTIDVHIDSARCAAAAPPTGP